MEGQKARRWNDRRAFLFQGDSMMKISWIVALTLMASCAKPSLPPENTDSSTLLPDLRIKKIEYRQQNRQVIRRLSVYEPNLTALNYEFTVHIENIGNKRFEEPFYLSISGSLTDYQDYLFSRHVRLNDERRAIEPGNALPFIARITLDFPPPFTKMSHYPVRFYINTEGSTNSTGFPTVYIAERSYKNNFYELQIRL